MLKRRLRHFDYEAFLACIEGMADLQGRKKQVRTVFFLGIPLLKIKEGRDAVKYYLFGLLMVLRVKRADE